MYKKKFDYTQEMTEESLKMFLNTNNPFAGRKKDDSKIKSLLKRLKKYGISFYDIKSALAKTMIFLPPKEEKNVSFPLGWSQVKFVNIILSMVNEDYWNDYKKSLPKSVAEEIEKWRKEFNKKSFNLEEF